MFTGIIQALGTIRRIEPLGDAIRMQVECPGFFAQVANGDSVANNGVCLTAETSTTDTATFTLIRQTLQNTSFGQAKLGTRVNLELPCRPDSLMGGHFVMGHIDGVAQVNSVQNPETGLEVWFSIDESYQRYIIARGSISIDGVSLTVAEKNAKGFKVALIPETLRKTNALDWVPSVQVNIEVDMIGKYVENHMLASRQADAV